MEAMQVITTPRARKRRSDRNHAIYQIVCRPTGERYIGLTVVRGRAFQKSVMIRWAGHVHHALVENRNYPLQQRIREFGPEEFDHELIQVVKGKQPAHDLEKSLISALKPELNVECTGKKNHSVTRRDAVSQTKTKDVL